MAPIDHQTQVGMAIFHQAFLSRLHWVTNGLIMGIRYSRRIFPKTSPRTRVIADGSTGHMPTATSKRRILTDRSTTLMIIGDAITSTIKRTAPIGCTRVDSECLKCVERFL